MRILHTSDWHLGRNLEQISRIGEQREFIDHLCRTVEEQNIELVLVAGDIYDTCNPSAAAEELFYEAIDRLGGDGSRAVVVIAGNHDSPERLCAASPLARRKGIILLGYPGSDAGADSKEDHAVDHSEDHSNDHAEILEEYHAEDHSEDHSNDHAEDHAEYHAEVRAADHLEDRISDHTESFSTASIPPAVHITDSGPGWLELSIPGCEHHAVVITMPYPSEARLEELLTRDADEAALQQAYSERVGGIFRRLEDKFREDTVNLVVAHLFLLGGSTSDSERTLQVGGAMTVDPSVMPAKAHYAALGHLHRPQEIRNAPCPVFYAGSPLAYSFSEADYTKAVYIIDAKPGEKAAVTPCYLDCGRPLRKWLADRGMGQALEWCREGRDANAWIDLEIVTDRIFTSEEQKTLRSLNPGIINIRPRIKSEDADILEFQSREGRKIDELFGDYYRYRMGTDIPDELMSAFLEVVNGDSEESDETVQECAAAGENGEEAIRRDAEKECAASGEGASADEDGDENTDNGNTGSNVPQKSTDAEESGNKGVIGA